MPRCWFRHRVRQASADGTHKWLLAMGVDGKNAIETVYIRTRPRHAVRVLAGRLRPELHVLLHCYPRLQPQPDHRRDHRPGVVAARHLGNVPHQMRRLTNVVMMGMGEPLMNFDNVVRAMSVMRDDLGYGRANKRVTLSTSGLVPQIDRLSAESDVSLAVSLHAPRRTARDAGAAQQEVPDRRADGFVRTLPARQQAPRSVTFEYTLMKGINDKPEHARELARLMRQFDNAVQAKDSGKVNLIPFNPFPGTRYERGGQHPRLPEDPARQQRADDGPPPVATTSTPPVASSRAR